MWECIKVRGTVGTKAGTHIQKQPVARVEMSER